MTPACFVLDRHMFTHAPRAQFEAWFRDPLRGWSWARGYCPWRSWTWYYHQWFAT